MFYSPFDACNVCKQYVLLDQTRTQCAAEHGCSVEKCPLERFFAEGYTRDNFPERSPDQKD